MARFKIIKEIDGLTYHYAGYQAESFSDCGPIFNRTLTERGKFDEATADAAIKQLSQMGHHVEKKMLLEKRKKGL